MFPTTKAVKTTALEILKGNWIKASCAALIPVAEIFIFAILGEMLICVSTLKSVWIPAFTFGIPAFVFAVCPTILGCVRFFRRFSQEKGTQLDEIFFYFSSVKEYRRSVSFVILFLLRVAIIGFFLLLPSLLTDLAYRGRLDFLVGDATPLWFNDLWIISVFLRGIAAVALAVILLRYYLAPFIFVSNDSISSPEAIHLSSCAAKISTTAFASLILSTLLWLLISILIVPMVFTLPYLLTCYTVHCNFAVFHYNKSLRLKNSKENFDPDFEI